jgi:hypothetical protein
LNDASTWTGSAGLMSDEISEVSAHTNTFSDPILLSLGAPEKDVGLAIDGSNGPRAAAATEVISYAFSSPVPIGTSFLLWGPGEEIGNYAGPFTYTFSATLGGQAINTSDWTFSLRSTSESATAWNYSRDPSIGQITAIVPPNNDLVTPPVPDAVIIATPNSPVDTIKVTANTISGDAWGVALAGGPATISLYFNATYYLNQNPDVRASGVDPLTHYEQIGWTEGRDPSDEFSTGTYLLANPDVAAAHVDPLLHYINSGQNEGRIAFLATPHGVGPQNPLVDNNYYFSQYADIRAAGVDPFAHYDATGWKELRNPDALFDTAYYLQQNPDVAAAGIDPLLHYEGPGWKEGRSPSPSFSTSKYLAANPDVAAAGINPLVHYETVGMNEGRVIFHL